MKSGACESRARWLLSAVVSNDIRFRDVPFQLPNATGNFTITDTGGPGLTPKACIIVLSGATAIGTETNPARVAIGLTDGTNAIAMAWMAEHGVVDTNADTGRRRANDKILNLTATTAEALAVGATFVSLGTNALTINMEHASTLRGFVRFMYGAQLQAKVTTVTSALLVNTAVNSPSLGFQADGVICISARTAWNVDAGLANAIASIGCAGRLPSISQACMNVVAGDRISPTSVGQKPRDDRVLSIVISTAGVITEAVAIEVTAFNADDIEFTTREIGEAIGIGMLAFSLNGEKCHAGCPALNSDTMGISSYTTPGFRARALFVLGQAAATVNTLDTTTGAMSIGVFSPATVATGEYAAKWNDADAQSTSISTSALTENQIVHVESKWAARVNRITATGFDYNVLVTASADLPTVVFSIGEQPPYTPFVSKARILGIPRGAGGPGKPKIGLTKRLHVEAVARGRVPGKPARAPAKVPLAKPSTLPLENRGLPRRRLPS